MKLKPKMKKSPLKQEDPKPTYNNMPTSRIRGFKERDYTPTAKDSAKYREGYSNPDKLYTDMFRTAGRIEALKERRAKKSPLKQEDPKKTPYIPGRATKEQRAAAEAKKSVAREKMKTRFETNASNRGMTPVEYSNFLDKQSRKKDVPAGNPREFKLFKSGKSANTSAKCPSMPG